MSSWMQQHSAFLSSRLGLGNIMLQNQYFSPDPEDLGTVPHHDFEPNLYLRAGWMFFNNNIGSQSGIVYFGIDKSGDVVPAYTSNSTGLPISLNFNYTCISSAGKYVTSYYWYSTYGTVAVDPALGTSVTLYMLFPVVNSSVTPIHYQDDIYCVCISPSPTINTGNAASACNGGSFYGQTWPDFQRALFSWNGTFVQNYYGAGNMNVPTKLVTENTVGVLNLLVEFVDQQIVFQNAQSPAIVILNNYIDNVKGTVILYLYSTTIGGQCIIATSPAGVIASQSITVGIVPANITLQLTVPVVCGTLPIFFQCYKYQTSYNVTVNYNVAEITTNETLSSGNGVTDSLGSGVSFNIPFLSGASLGGISFDPVGFFSGPWWSWIVNILYYLLIGIVIVAFLYVMFILARMFFYKYISRSTHVYVPKHKKL
jgi:hypothetical protein